MDAYRGAHQKPWDKEWTDSRAPEQYVEKWKNSGRISLNGTKKRPFKRGTNLSIGITDDDVCALFNALLERRAEDECTLRRALDRIKDLVRDRSRTGESASSRSLLELIQEEACSALDPPRSETRRSDHADWNPFRQGASPAKRDGRR